MKRVLLPLLVLIGSLSLEAQTTLTGTILDDAGNPLVGATVSLANQGFSTTTNESGAFTFLYLEAGDEEVLIDADGFVPGIELVQLQSNETHQMDAVRMQRDIAKEAQDEVILNLAEADLNDDEGKSQAQASTSSASTDVFNNTTSFAWSTARYRKRGYEQPFETYYINGLNFNTAERGNFNFGAMGGLNDASRYREVVNPYEANNFGFGDISTATNYLMYASNYAQGWKVSAAGTNRNYKAAVRATYASGPIKNGWSFVGQVAFRFSPYIDNKGIIGEGIQYYSLGYFLAAEKKWDNGNRFAITTFGAPTLRGQSGAVTQEVYDLTGTINYNPYWGYQNGQVRNSRNVKTFDPTAILNYDLKIDEDNIIKFALGYHYNFYSNSALTFFNAPDPRPDYYRNLPSFLWDGQLSNPYTQDKSMYKEKDGNGNTFNHQLYDMHHPTSEGSTSFYNHFPYGNFIGASLNNVYLGEGFTGADGYVIGPSVDQASYNDLVHRWQTRDPNSTQINWDNLYAANYANNITDPTGSAKYMIERRHNDLQEAAANILYQNTQFKNLKMTLGLEGKYSNGIHYKSAEDLLGGNQWIDVDPFADRDIKDLGTNVGLSQTEIALVRENDIMNGNKVIRTNDKFGYDYRMHMGTAKLWFQNEWTWTEWDLYYAVQATFSSMQRTTNMLNGRAWYLAEFVNPDEAGKYVGYKHANAQGVILPTNPSNYTLVGNAHYFVDPAAKIGATYKINGRNHIKLNAMAMTKAPLARDAYISQRVHDRVADNIYVHDNARNLADFYAASQKVVGGDLTYEFNYPIVRGRITAYYTQFWNGTELNGYYDDEARTFVNQAITGINKRHMGIEAAAAIKLGNYFTLTPVVAVGDYRYVSNAYSITSAENGMALGENKLTGENIYEVRDSVLMRGLRVSNGPQVNTSLKLSFFHPKMWFADITVSYYDWNFLDFAPSRRMKGLFTGTRADGSTVNGWYGENTYTNAIQTTDGAPAIQSDNGGYPTNAVMDANGVPVLKYPFNLMSDQESLVAGNVWNRFIIDLSVGKLIYLKNRQSLSINLSVTNVTNNTQFKTGGYQQARLPRATLQGTIFNTKKGTQQSVITANPWKFPSKYYYAWGANFYLTITYKF